MNWTKYDVYSRLLEDVHILIGGSVGSGKSVVMNALVATLLTYSPTEKCMMLIDPKRVDLKRYKDTAHCLGYASETHDIISLLQKASRIMDYRYQVMEEQDIDRYEGADLYIFVDEFGDLMTTIRKEFLPLFKHITQLGRAAGIHVVVATQCTLRSVIPTEVKINLDTRVALRVPSPLDSRNVLDCNGAEKLPKYGQGLIRWRGEVEPELWELPMYDKEDLRELARVRRAV